MPDKNSNASKAKGVLIYCVRMSHGFAQNTIIIIKRYPVMQDITPYHNLSAQLFLMDGVPVLWFKPEYFLDGAETIVLFRETS